MTPRRAASSRSVEEVDADLVDVRGERRTYARANNRIFAEDVAANAARMVAQAQATVDALAAEIAVTGVVPLGHPMSVALAEAAAIVSAGKALRVQAGQVAGALDGPAKSEVEAKLADFDKRLADLEAEKLGLLKAARIAEVEAEFAGVGGGGR